jgi:hypothetical protein
LSTSRWNGPQSRFNVKDFLRGDDEETPAVVAITAAGLLIAIAIIHLQDQGGLLGSESPTWLKWGYYLVELTSLVAAVLVARKKTAGWVLGLGASVGPFTGYILSRSVGIPGDSGDIGNWGYTLGTVSLLVEGAFVIIACVCLYRIYRVQGTDIAEFVTPQERERVRVPT